MGFLQNIFYNKSIQRLRQMLESIRMRDYSLQYSLKRLSGEELRLAEEINAVIREFRETEHKREGETMFYDALLSTVDAILITTDESGRVRWMNNAAIERLCGFRFERLSDLASLHPSLPIQLEELHCGSSRLVTFNLSSGEERQYAASLTKIFVRGVGYRLYSLQSVAVILKQGEINAQQKLIRVLTHEIMNSLTPIVSLSETLADNMKGPEKLISEDEATYALSTISRRAKGLMQFVQRYRTLSGIAQPAIQRIRINTLVQGMQDFCAIQTHKHCKVDFDVQCKDNYLPVDASQMEQVFINLLKNALETKATHICVTAKLSNDERWAIFTIEDNGGGFENDISDNLFTPFFTTKSEGQGIGLAVCRQIVSNHGGLIGAENAEVGARFTVRLPM